jgi:chitosanase
MKPASITDEQYQKVLALTELSETHKLKNYGTVTVIKGDTGNLTYGRFQTTLSSGNLYTLLRDYVSNGGEYADDIAPYLKALKEQNTSLNNNTAFKATLRAAGKDPIMHSTQDEFFDKVYWAPANGFFANNGFKLPLSLAIIHDSFIHSGGIRSQLRNQFRETPPAAGGTEKGWITAYLKTRHKWLANHSRKDLRNSSYRTKELLRLINEDDWELESPFTYRGIAL